MNIRPATIEDLSKILEINLRSIFEICVSHYKLEVLKQWVGSRSEASFSRSFYRRQLFVAEEEGCLYGFLDVTPGEILAIYTQPDRERQGIGRQLLFKGIEEASKGKHEVVLNASLNAVTFYEKYGFVKEKEINLVRNGIALPLIKMRLKRSPNPK